MYMYNHHNRHKYRNTGEALAFFFKFMQFRSDSSRFKPDKYITTRANGRSFTDNKWKAARYYTRIRNLI